VGRASALGDLLGLLPKGLEVLAGPVPRHQRVRPGEPPPREPNGDPPVDPAELAAAGRARTGRAGAHGLHLLQPLPAGLAPVFVEGHGLVPSCYRYPHVWKTTCITRCISEPVTGDPALPQRHWVAPTKPAAISPSPTKR